MAEGLKINIGSGQRKFKPPWINADKIYARKVVRVGDNDVDAIPNVACDGALLPLPGNSAEIVVLHHVYEHFHLGDGENLIRETYRVLKLGGQLLVFVPDLRKLAQRWLIGQISDYTFAVNVYGAWMGLDGDDHHWGWSQEGLMEHLKKLEKWATVKSFSWRTIDGADIARDWWIAGVEAIK